MTSNTPLSKKSECLDRGTLVDREPLVSIVTVSYNAERYIAKLLSSVCSQTCARFEHIIVDGNSTDRTMEIVRSYKDKYVSPLKWLSEPDKGIYDAMNKGIQMASGKYIHLLNCDDEYFDSNSLQMVANQLEEQAPELLSTSVEYILPSRKVKLSKGKNRDWDAIPHPGLFVSSVVYKSFPFDTTYRYAADIDLFLRIQGRFSLKVSPLTTVKMLAGGAGSSYGCLKETLFIYLKHKKYLRSAMLAKPFMGKLLGRLR